MSVIKDEVSLVLNKNDKLRKEINSCEDENKKLELLESYHNNTQFLLATKYFYAGNDASFIENYDEATEYYRKAIELKPDFHEAYNNMGNAYNKKCNYNEAIKCYKKAIEIKPDYHEAYNNMGNAYAHKGNYDEAINFYKKAIEIKLDYHEAYYNLAVVSHKIGAIVMSKIYLKKAAQLGHEIAQEICNKEGIDWEEE